MNQNQYSNNDHNNKSSNLNNKESELFPNYKNNSISKSNTYSSNNTKEYSPYDEHYFNWKKKYEEGMIDMNNTTSLEKIDTRGVPNNLFEMKHKEIEKTYPKNDYNRNDNRFASVSSDPNYKDTMTYKGEDPGMIGTFGSLVGDAFSRTKEVISGVKGKYSEYEVTDKIKTTGEATLGVLKYTGNTIHTIATSETTKQIIGKTTENIGYLFNRIFYGKTVDNENNNTNSISSSNNNDSNFIDNDDSYKKQSYNRYSPPRNSGNDDDELSGKVLFKKDNSRYSSKSYMS